MHVKSYLALLLSISTYVRALQHESRGLEGEGVEDCDQKPPAPDILPLFETHIGEHGNVHHEVTVSHEAGSMFGGHFNGNLGGDAKGEVTSSTTASGSGAGNIHSSASGHANWGAGFSASAGGDTTTSAKGDIGSTAKGQNAPEALTSSENPEMPDHGSGTSAYTGTSTSNDDDNSPSTNVGSGSGSGSGTDTSISGGFDFNQGTSGDSIDVHIPKGILPKAKKNDALRDKALSISMFVTLLSFTLYSML